MIRMQQRVKCLLVDDLEENLLALSALLRRDDVEVLTARSGSEALELLLVHDVALALLDVQMPRMDGFELAELMRFISPLSRTSLRTRRKYSFGSIARSSSSHSNCRNRPRRYGSMRCLRRFSDMTCAIP
jgi:ActR/RegA family two-component response regulator